MAQLAGHKSVKDFLDSLNGRGDYAHEDNLPPEEEELNDLLGFSKNGIVANMSDGQLYEFKAALNLEMMKTICQEEENKLNIYKSVYDESHNFLGFYKDSDIGLLENNVECNMESSFPMKMKMECKSFDGDMETLSIPENAFIKSESYGEIASEALKDTNWHSPVCRGICNCSFCRTKAGKRPTGILSLMARQADHKSVKDFLDSLNGRGDYAHENNLPPEEEELNDLLGFSKNGIVANMSDGQLYEFKAALNLEMMKTICQEEENKLNIYKSVYDESHNFLGFYKDSDIGDGQLYEFKAALNLEMMKTICQEEENKLNIYKSVYDESHNFLGFYKDSDIGLLENNVECDMKSSFPMKMKMECKSFDEDMETLSIPENAFIKSESDIEEPTISGAYLDNKIEDFNSYAHPIKTEELPPILYPVTFEPVTENGAGSGYLDLKVENNFDPCDRPIKTEEMPPILHPAILHPVTFVSVTENVNPQLKVEIKDEPVDNGNSSSMPDPLAITPKDIKNLTSPQNVFLSVEGILERENRNRPDLMRTYSIDEFEKFYDRKIIEYGYACTVREIGRRLLEHSLSTRNHPN